MFIKGGNLAEVQGEIGVERLCNGDSIAIFGVHPKPSIVQRILMGDYDKAYIFLDGDNPTVRMKAREIPKRLPFIKCEIIETGCDPKHLSKEQIEELIK